MSIGEAADTVCEAIASVGATFRLKAEATGFRTATTSRGFRL